MKAKGPSLKITSGNRAGEVFELEENKRYIFGRDPSADFHFPEKKISRRHACIHWNAFEKSVILEDLQSLNGTYVNGNAIMKPVRLNDHDKIQVGANSLELSLLHSDLIFAPPTEGEYISEVSGTKTQYPASEPTERTREHDMGDANQSGIINLDAETGGRLLSGKLNEVPLADLLQMLANARKSGRLILSKDRILFEPRDDDDRTRTSPPQLFSLYLWDGDLLYVEGGELVNEDAFYLSLRMTDGHFALFPAREPYTSSTFPKKLETPIEALLLEGFRRWDEEKAKKSGRSDKADFSGDDEFEVNLDQPLTTLDPEQLKVFQLVWKNKKVAKVLNKAEMDEKTVQKLLRQLVKLGFLAKG